MNTEIKLHDLIAGITSNLELERLKEIINEQIEANADDPCNFMYHTTVDNYFYYVFYSDGSQHMGCIGQREYERYLYDSEAVSIWRQDKDVLWHKEKNYPMELLMQKG